ncbi:MAG: hypothetical protein J5U16_01170 [Candidatus Methanoperedens sp.]|nr:hypothetical protein [Candidatus Methanoperedens sp.]
MELIENHILNSQSGIACGEKSRKVGYPHLRMNNISNNMNLDLKLLWRIPATENEIRSYSLQKGDILFNNTNSADLVRKCCLFDIDSNETFLFSNHLTRIRTKNTLNAKYLLYWVNFLWQKQYFKDNCDKWVNQAAIRVEDWIFPFEIPLPPTPSDQLAITSDLEYRMAHVEKMRAAALRQLDAAKAMSAALLNEMFSQETFDGYPMVRLEDWTCDIASGQAVSSVGGNYQKQGIRYIQGNNLTNKGFAPVPIVYTEVKTHAAMSRSVVKPKDVLINIVGPHIGKISWYPEDQPEANINQAVVRVHCPEDLDYRFLTYLLRTKKYYDYFVEVKVGARQWNISRTNCADIKIPRVPIYLQHDLVKKFEEKIDGISFVAAAERQLEAIEALPGAILREVFDFDEENTGS